MMSTNKKDEGRSRNYISATEASHIYVLPNLMTAGNLLCGFLAVIRCIQAKFAESRRISDDIVKEAQDTISLLDKYVEDIDTTLDKERIKSKLKSLYIEAGDIDI